MTMKADLPKPPHTPARSVKVPDPIWEAARRTAAARGETMTAAVIRFLTVYGADELEEEQRAAGTAEGP